MKIGELCSYAPKSQIKAGEAIEGAKYMFFTSSADENKRYSEYQFDGEGIIMGTGGNATLHYYSGKYSTSTDCVVLLPNEKVRCKYLYYYLKANMNVLEAGFKGAGLKHTNKKYINDICIDNIPDCGKQDKIIYILDKIQGIIDSKNQELKWLDYLIKARFVELFGTCKNLLSMNELCSIITDGTHQPPKFQKSGIPFIFVSNLANNTVTYDTEKFISQEIYSELYKRTPVEIGDLLLSTVGSYGHPAVVVKDKKFLFQRHIAYLKPKGNIVNSFYLHSALLAPDGQRQIEGKVKGIAQKTLNLSEIKKIVVPIPPIEEQNEFERFVHQVDKSKVVYMYILKTRKYLMYNSKYREKVNCI